MRKRLILVLLLALIASAEGTSVNAGCFNVTFDMGVQSLCRASVSSGDSAFLINVNYGNYSAAIMGSETSGASLSSADRNVRDLLGRFNVTKADLYTRTIDGKMAILGVGERPWSQDQNGSKVFVASYPTYLAKDGLAYDVVVASFFPWSAGTERLLNTLRVKRILQDDENIDEITLGGTAGEFKGWHRGWCSVSPTIQYGTLYRGSPYVVVQAKIETSGDNNTNSIDTSGIESLIYNGYITFIDNSGESMENSIKILHAKGEDDGIASEYYYLQSRYGRPKVDWNLNSQSTVATNGRAYDKMDIQLSDGMRKTIYFDITEFFGKFNRLS